MKKRGALELSVGTIVIIVLAMTMLILGMVLVRSIMCGAIGLTGETNAKVSAELNKLFEASTGEVACIGIGEPIAMVPGKLNKVYCSVKADKLAKYKMEIKGITAGNLKEAEIREWIIIEGWNGDIPPGDEIAKTVLALQVPDDAPHDTIVFDVQVSRDGSPITTQQLFFEIKRLGLVKAAVC